MMAGEGSEVTRGILFFGLVVLLLVESDPVNSFLAHVDVGLFKFDSYLQCSICASDFSPIP